MYEVVDPPRDRDELGRVLAEQGVAERAYSLWGAHLDDSVVMDHRGAGWVVFYSERGGEFSLREHPTEAEACADLLVRVLGNEHARFELVAGPAPADEADAAFGSWLASRGMSRAELAPGDYKVDEVPWAAGEPSYRRYFVRIKRSR